MEFNNDSKIPSASDLLTSDSIVSSDISQLTPSTKKPKKPLRIVLVGIILLGSILLGRHYFSLPRLFSLSDKAQESTLPVNNLFIQEVQPLYDTYGCTMNKERLLKRIGATGKNTIPTTKQIQGDYLTYPDSISTRYSDSDMLSGYGIYDFTIQDNNIDWYATAKYIDSTLGAKSAYRYNVLETFAENKYIGRNLDGRVIRGSNDVSIISLYKDGKTILTGKEYFIDRNSYLGRGLEGEQERFWSMKIEKQDLHTGTNVYVVRYNFTGYTLCDTQYIFYAPIQWNRVSVGDSSILLPDEKYWKKINDEQYATSRCLFDLFVDPSKASVGDGGLPPNIQKKDKNGALSTLSSCIIFSPQKGYIFEARGGAKPTDPWDISYNGIVVKHNFPLIQKNIHDYSYHYHPIPSSLLLSGVKLGAQVIREYYSLLSQNYFVKAAALSKQDPEKLAMIYNRNANDIVILGLWEDAGVYHVYVGDSTDTYFSQKKYENNTIVSLGSKKLVANTGDEIIKYYTDSNITLVKKEDKKLESIYENYKEGMPKFPIGDREQGKTIRSTTYINELQKKYNKDTPIKAYTFARKGPDTIDEPLTANDKKVTYYIIPNTMNYTDTHDISIDLGFGSGIGDRFVLQKNDKYILLAFAILPGNNMILSSIIENTITLQ